MNSQKVKFIFLLNEDLSESDKMIIFKKPENLFFICSVNKNSFSKYCIFIN